MSARALAEEQFAAAKRMLTAAARAALRGECTAEAALDAVRAVELAREQLQAIESRGPRPADSRRVSPRVRRGLAECDPERDSSALAERER